MCDEIEFYLVVTGFERMITEMQLDIQLEAISRALERLEAEIQPSTS